MKQPLISRIFKTAGMIGFGGIALGTACNVDTVTAVLTGVEAVGRSLDRSSRDSGDLDFGEWLAQEIDHL